MIVMKFGGTSVGTTDSIDSAAKIVAAAVERQTQRDGAEESPGVLVVVSGDGRGYEHADRRGAGGGGRG